jgi:antitoxin (DNA-binding transcriptional repressor) of toxin-antitoxin stability system
MKVQVLHITEADLVRDVRAILQQVETGAEIVIERGAQPVAVLRAASPVRLQLSECIALLSDDSQPLSSELSSWSAILKRSPPRHGRDLCARSRLSALLL